MNCVKIYFLLAVCLLFVSTLHAQYVTIDDAYSPQQLIQNVLVNSPCANVSNISASGSQLNPGEQSFGYFNAGSSGFPFSEGVVLCTSRANRAAGPNSNLIDEGATSWLGDSDLETAINFTDTFNATVLEFDFTPLTSYFSFDYIFASEEYQGTAPCQYSDGFAFLLKEANTSNPYQNLALIPNTNTPVLVTTVHPEIPNRCPAINENYFGGYNGSNAPINYNGQTVVMTAQSTVIPGVTYHIKLVIADHENVRYDSAIFLGGGSFKVGTDIGPDRLIATNNPVCDTKSIDLNATELGANSYRWFKNSIEIPGATNAIYSTNSPGIYSVEISLGSSGCIATGSVVIEFVPLPLLTDTIFVQCDENQDGSALFNLGTVENIVRNNDSSLSQLTYYENLVDAQNQNTSNAIANPNNYSSLPKIIFASASNAYGCFGTATIELQISNNTVPAFRDYETCDLDTNIDGFYGITLNDVVPNVIDGLPPGIVVNFYPTFEDAVLQINSLPVVYTNSTQFIDTIYARLINGGDCYGIIPVILYINSNSPDNFGDQEVFVCNSNPETVFVASSFNSYNWSNGDSDFTTTLSIPGDYTVTVTDNNGCEAIKKFIVSASELATIIDISINDFQINSNSLYINAVGAGDYEYSLDGIFFQDSPYFSNVIPGEFNVVARDKKGCGEVYQTIFVMSYPVYFTPNGDGYNDVWKIDNLETKFNAMVTIFDRYGKFIHRFNSKSDGWDGTFIGKTLPSDDYWFVLTFDPDKTIKGHFALKR